MANYPAFRGRSRPTALPAWRRGMVAGTWKQVSGSTLASVDPQDSALYNPNGAGAAAPWRGTTGQLTITDAWGSMWLDPQGIAYIGGGGNGGHTNYAGNEFYAFDATQNTPAWTMVRPPSGAVGDTITLDDGQEATGLYSDGRLRAVHSYNNMVFVPGLGPVIYRPGTSTFSSGQAGTDKVWTINVTTGEALGPSAEINNAGVGYSGFGNSGNAYGGCAYDPTRERVYGMGSGSSTFLTYANVGAAGASWSAGYLGSAQQGVGTYGSLTYLPTMDRLLLWTGSSYVKFLHPVDGSAVVASVTGSPPSGFTDSGGAAIEWCPQLGKLLLWNHASNTGVIATLTLGATTADPLTWGSLTVDGSNSVTPPAASGNGTFGKFRYSPALKGCFLQPASNADPMYFFATE